MKLIMLRLKSKCSNSSSAFLKHQHRPDSVRQAYEQPTSMACLSSFWKQTRSKQAPRTEWIFLFKKQEAYSNRENKSPYTLPTSFCPWFCLV